MKTIYKGNNFVIQWSIMDAVTSLPFDFNDMFVEFIVYSDNYKGRISGCKITGNKMQAEIMANTLPVGVYDIVCSYKNSMNSGHCICRRAFNITRNPDFCSNTDSILIESYASPLKLENMDINYLGHFTSEGVLPDSDKPAWALVGTLKFARPWFFYTANVVPPGFQTGWNDLSEVLGTYDLTADKVSIFDFNLVTEYNVSRNHPNIKRDFSNDWGMAKGYYPEYDKYKPCKVYNEGERANMPDYTENTFIALRETYQPPFITIEVSSEFTLGEAVAITPEQYRYPGIRLTFVNSKTHQAETWFWLGGEWEDEDKWIKPISDVTINNLPDEEDISTTKDSIPRLQLKDKLHDKNSYSGLGRCYLRKNMVDGVNVLTQDMFTNADGSSKKNTRYIIQYDYDLMGATIEIPEGCVLEFQGGSLSNGILLLNSTELSGNPRLDVLLNGNAKNRSLYMEWFVNADKFIDNLRSIHLVATEYSTIYFPSNGAYEINPNNEIVLNLKSKINIDGRGCLIKIIDGANNSNNIWKLLFKATDVENIKIANVRLDCNGVNNQFKCKPGDAAVTDEYNGFIRLLRANNVEILNCEVYNCYGYNDIVIAYSHNVTVDRCKFINCGVLIKNDYVMDHSNVFSGGSTKLRVTNNYIYNDFMLTNGTGIDMACQDSVFIGNHMENCNSGMNQANNGTFNCKNNIISDNVFANCRCAIYFWAYISSSITENIIFKNNIIYWKARGYQYECRGIDLFRYAYGLIRNINISGNTIYSIVDEDTDLTKSFEHAILVGASMYNIVSSITNANGSVENISITNNFIHNITALGIGIYARANNVSICNNHLFDCNISDYSVKSAILITSDWVDTYTENINVSGNLYYNKEYSKCWYGVSLVKLVKNVKILYNDFKTDHHTALNVTPTIDESKTYGDIREGIFVRGFLSKSENGFITNVKCCDGSELYDAYRGITYKPNKQYSIADWKFDVTYNGKQNPGVAMPNGGSIVWNRNPKDSGSVGSIYIETADGVTPPKFMPFGRDCMCEIMGGGIRPEKHAYGYPFFDTNLGKPIWQKADGTWVDANGEVV